jgi:hypothetical protein
MVELDDQVLEETAHEGQSQRLVDVVGRIERAHPETRGVSMETIRAYADALEGERTIDVDADGVLDSVGDRLVEGRTWASENALYELDGAHVSRYPKRWHEALGDSSDVAEYVAFLTAEDDGPGAGDRGIREDVLLDVLGVVGGLDRDDAAAALQEAREEGVLVEDADQHPQAGVYLRDGAETLRDHTLDDDAP